MGHYVGLGIGLGRHGMAGFIRMASLHISPVDVTSSHLMSPL